MGNPVGMELSSRRLGATTAVLTIGGEVDLYTTPQVKEEIVGLIDAGVRRLVVDLSAAEYLDSTALGTLVGALKRLREHDGELRLANPAPRIRKLLEITRLLKVFEVRDSVAQALEGWHEQGATA
ncbi:MAG TPA: STAS domain-containing protein [Armatimonadota bacterium]|nr:STAS domain-containing protein [Armatimonadota bacterium]